MAAKNDIWMYFENNTDMGVAVCKTCKNKLRNNRVSNLKAHLIKLHKINFNEVSNEQLEPESSISLKSVVKPIRKKKIKIEVNKKQLIRSYIGLVTEDCIPFNILNSPNIRNFIDPICDGLRVSDGKKITLNASNCKKTLHMVANNVKLEITNEVKNNLLSLKIDSATRLSRNIFGVSAQFISAGRIKSIILGMIELKGAGSSTAKNLAFEVLNVLKRYNINLTQIVSITSDNGANMLRATNILSFVSEEDVEENDEFCTNHEYLKKIEFVEKVPHVLIGNIQVCRCAAHTTQLVALDVAKSLGVLAYLWNCRNLTKYIRKTSNGYREIFQLKGLKIPQLDCPTRWGSTYAMLQDLLAAKYVLTKIESIKNKSEDENFEIDALFWDFIECYCTVFRPLQKTITKFQEEQLHYGNFYAQWLKLKISTEKIVCDSSQELIKTIGNMILKSIETRTIMLFNNKFLISCLFLDPRFQHTLTAQQKTEAILHLKTIWDRIHEINPTGPLCSTPTSASTQTGNFFDEEDELLYRYLVQGTQAEINNTFDAYARIEHLQLPFQRIDDVLKFWKGKQYTDPELYAISNVCFAVPPTQVNRTLSS